MIKYQISDDSHFNIFLFSQWNIMARYRYQYAYFIDCYRHFANICFFLPNPIYHVYTVIHFTLHSVHGLGSALDTRVANFNDTAHDVCAEDFFPVIYTICTCKRVCCGSPAGLIAVYHTTPRCISHSSSSHWMPTQCHVIIQKCVGVARVNWCRRDGNLIHWWQ